MDEQAKVEKKEGQVAKWMGFLRHETTALLDEIDSLTDDLSTILNSANSIQDEEKSPDVLVEHAEDIRIQVTRVGYAKEKILDIRRRLELT